MSGLNDGVVEQLWKKLDDVALDYKGGEVVIAEQFHIFKQGTSIERIEDWFDNAHSQGIEYLINV